MLIFRLELYCVLDKLGNSVVVELFDGVQYKRNFIYVKKFFEWSNVFECEMFLLFFILNSFNEY